MIEAEETVTTLMVVGAGAQTKHIVELGDASDGGGAQVGLR